MISFLKMLLRASYKFKVKEKKSLIVFDDEEKLECARLFKKIKNKTLILPVRFYAINEIYLTPGILLKTIKFIFLGNYNFSAYLSALILEIEAKVVVSTMDNSIQFSNAAKILKNKVEFIAIQRAACDSIIFLPNKIVKKIFIPKFLCFGELEKKLYKATSAQVHKFIPVGSYHNSNFENYYKKKIKIKYDLCLLAEIPYTNSEDSVERSSEELDRGFTLINFT